jgi:hypothetical protein
MLIGGFRVLSVKRLTAWQAIPGLPLRFSPACAVRGVVRSVGTRGGDAVGAALVGGVVARMGQPQGHGHIVTARGLILNTEKLKD